jgi:hypothetical protein
MAFRIGDQTTFLGCKGPPFEPRALDHYGRRQDVVLDLAPQALTLDKVTLPVADLLQAPGSAFTHQSQ